MGNHLIQPIRSRQRRVAARLMTVGLLLPLSACASDGWMASLGFSSDPAVGDTEVSATSLMRVSETTAALGEYATAAGLYSRAHALTPGAVPPTLAPCATPRRMGAPPSAADSYRPGRTTCPPPLAKKRK